ncbi:MAG TPA: molybdopterin dinucleotide binding domain-containing protein [Gemmatimonadaceae bacterium]|nr:molybdopterin dinucleotide binding domain-containing protein [Gemmatimonadaceae bacterium]
MALYNPPLQVIQLIATSAADAERGPAVWMRSEEAYLRLLQDGELVWVQTPRRKELARLIVDDSIRRGTVVLRDIVGAGPSEIVTVTKPDLDNPPRRDLA